MSIVGLKRSNDDSKEAQQRELQNKRNKIASDIRRSEDLYAAATMQLDGGEECPPGLVQGIHPNDNTKLKYMLQAVKMVIEASTITGPEVIRWIKQSVQELWLKTRNKAIDPESDKLIDEISLLLRQDIKPMSFAYGCKVIAVGAKKKIENLRGEIRSIFNQFIESERRANEFEDRLTSEDQHEMSRKEDAVMDARVGVLMEEYDGEKTEDATNSSHYPMFATERNEGEQMTRKKSVEEGRERNNRFRTTMVAKWRQAAQQRRVEAAAAAAAAAAADDDDDADSSENMVTDGGKRRTRKHKKQMKHKKTKRHRKNTKKHLKKRNNKKQRKTRNRK